LLLHRGELLADRPMLDRPMLNRPTQGAADSVAAGRFRGEHFSGLRARAETADDLRALYFRLTGESAGCADGEVEICEVQEDPDAHLIRRAGAAS